MACRVRKVAMSEYIQKKGVSVGETTGKVISFMHVRFQIQGTSVGFQREGVKFIGFQLHGHLFYV